MDRGFRVGSKNADVALQMASHPQDPLDLCYPWRGDANDLARARDWDFYRALDDVLLRYLMAGDSRPLCDLVLNLKQQPGEEAARDIAAMIAARKIRIETRGRPKKNEVALTRYLSELCLGLDQIGHRRAPRRFFWQVLARALNYEGDPDFLLKAKFNRGKGAPPNPELFRRDQALAWFVDKKRAEGVLRKVAIEQVRAEIEALGREERWEGKVGFETIRTAYKRFGAKKRRQK